jgi:hypothetical protein
MAIDDSFSRQTVEQLAKRAGHHCSNPECGASTIGASKSDPKKSVNVGVASHITAKAPGGPRYDANMTSDQRREITNGIWLCQNCAHYIDTNNGADHSVAQLRSWKQKHEENISASIGKAALAEMSELAGNINAAGIGNITGVDIRKPTRIRAGTNVSVSGIGNITGVKIGDR